MNTITENYGGYRLFIGILVAWGIPQPPVFAEDKKITLDSNVIRTSAPVSSVAVSPNRTRIAVATLLEITWYDFPKLDEEEWRWKSNTLIGPVGFLDESNLILATSNPERSGKLFRVNSSAKQTKELLSFEGVTCNKIVVNRDNNLIGLLEYHGNLSQKLRLYSATENKPIDLPKQMETSVNWFVSGPKDFLAVGTLLGNIYYRHEPKGTINKYTVKRNVTIRQMESIGNDLLVLTADGILRKVNLRADKQELIDCSNEGKIDSFSLSPNRQIIALAIEDSTQIILRSMESGRVVAIADKMTKESNPILWIDDRHLLTWRSNEKEVRIWKLTHK